MANKENKFQADLIKELKQLFPGCMILKNDANYIQGIPDLTIFFDVKPEVALKRITGDREVNRLDLESLDFHHKVYDGYQMICDKFPDRIVKVDASLPVEEVYRVRDGQSGESAI